jgi:hypothetical protein
MSLLFRVPFGMFACRGRNLARQIGQVTLSDPAQIPMDLVRLKAGLVANPRPTGMEWITSRKG